MPLQGTEERKMTKRSSSFSEDYRVSLFTLWYKNGKPNARMLLGMINKPDPLTNQFPSKTSLARMIKQEFIAKALYLDEEAAEELRLRLLADKIQMFDRHASIGVELIKIGADFLKDKGIGNARNALTAIIKGVEIEKESRGIRANLARIENMSDEELLGELEAIVESSEILDITPHEPETNETLSDLQEEME